MQELKCSMLLITNSILPCLDSRDHKNKLTKTYIVKYSKQYCLSSTSFSQGCPGFSQLLTKPIEELRENYVYMGVDYDGSY